MEATRNVKKGAGRRKGGGLKKKPVSWSVNFAVPGRKDWPFLEERPILIAYQNWCSSLYGCHHSKISQFAVLGSCYFESRIGEVERIQETLCLFVINSDGRILASATAGKSILLHKTSSLLLLPGAPSFSLSLLFPPKKIVKNSDVRYAATQMQPDLRGGLNMS